MKFKQITILDKITLSRKLITDLEKYSENPVKFFNSNPKDSNEIIKRTIGSDCILVSWRTPINKEIIEKCSDLKFICLCATNSDLIDLEECSKNNIALSNVKDYGDEGVVEWIFCELLNLLRGFNKYQWRDKPSELSGKTIGIIGLGTIGKMIADTAIGFKMKVLYYSKTRNKEYEEKGAIFADKQALLQKSDFITLQTPKNLKVLDGQDFELMQEKVLINNTLGKAFNEKNLITWIKKSNNYLIMDMATDFKDIFRKIERVILSNCISGLTAEATERLDQKTLNNITEFLKSNKSEV